MDFIANTRKNLLKATSNAANFIQLMFSCILLWWSIGDLLGVKFIIGYLNYLTQYPWNLCIHFTATIGFIGIAIDKYKCNLIFAISNIFLFGSVALAFWVHDPFSMSIGTYSVLLIFAFLLLDRIQRKRKIEILSQKT